MARHRRRRRRRPRAGSPQNSVAVADGSIVSPRVKGRKPSRCQEQHQDDEQEEGYAGPSLPEDIWCHIHSLLPLRDAARVACVSHAFRWSWRHLPKLAFSEDSLGVTRNALRKEGISSEIARKVDHILKNHSRTGVRTLELRLDRYNAKGHRRLDRWLQMAITPGIEKLSLSLSPKHDTYEFPCPLLSDGEKGDSLCHLQLSSCSFSPTAGPSCLRNLVILDLSYVNVKEGDGLWCLLSSSSSALERVTLEYCTGVTSLKIPGSLRRLGYLKVACCDDLQVVESNAPNLSMFDFAGDHRETQISLGGALRVKELHMDCSTYSCCSRAELVSSSMLDAETIFVHPSMETSDAPSKISSKSAHLERLYIAGIGRTPFYLSIKYCALVSLFGASHSVEDFVSYVSGQLTDHVSFCSALQGWKTSTLSAQEERMVQGACCMLEAWLS